MTFYSGQLSGQIDFILARWEDICAFLDCMVISGECVVVTDLGRALVSTELKRSR